MGDRHEELDSTRGASESIVSVTRCLGVMARIVASIQRFFLRLDLFLGGLSAASARVKFEKSISAAS